MRTSNPQQIHFAVVVTMRQIDLLEYRLSLRDKAAQSK